MEPRRGDPVGRGGVFAVDAWMTKALIAVGLALTAAALLAELLK